MSTLPVSEEFLSIQGESSYAGKVCWFIRLTGCNLRCSYCDTRYAIEPDSEHENHTIEDLVRHALESGTNIVEITGGEPLIHPGAIELARALRDAGLIVLVETNGSIDISALPQGVIRIMDIKTPSSGMADHNRWENLSHLTPQDEIKFVIGSRADFEFACDTFRTRDLGRFTREIRVSPVEGQVDPAELSRWILESKLPFALNLQLHKIIWPNTERGV